MPKLRRGKASLPSLIAALICLIVGIFPSVAAPEQAAVVRFAVIGDSGTGDKHQYDVARQMLAWHKRQPFQLVLMLGDNIYGGAWLGKGGKSKDFAAQFDLPYGELRARGVLFRAAIGNHDAETRDGQYLIESKDRFHIEGAEGYYNFTAGKEREGPLVEFFVLNTNRLADGMHDAEQLAWLRSKLSASHARWRVVYGHHPMYSTGRRHGSEMSVRAQVEPLLVWPVSAAPDTANEVGPQVHAYLAGHDHFYQRFRPQKGVSHFVCGSSGQLRRGNARPDSEVEAVEDQQRAFMLWEASAATLRFLAINEQGRAFDCGEISLTGSTTSVPCAALENALGR
jgi:hypothetical protein